MPPKYFIQPYKTLSRKIIKNKFDVYENQIGHYLFQFTIEVSENLFNDLRKYGIPYKEAINLFYSMTGNQYKPTI